MGAEGASEAEDEGKEVSMVKLAEKVCEDNIRQRIRRLADERKVALSAIAMKAKVEVGTIRALYEQDGVSKLRITEANAKKIELALDEQERALGMVKRCGKCGKTLPVGQFSRNRARRDGLQGFCKKCARVAEKESKRKKEGTVNNNTEKAITAEIVRRVKAEDKREYESKFMASYFGITPKQLDEVRKGVWDKLLLTPSVPKRADSVLEAVELLRKEAAELRREVESVMVELGVDVKTVAQ